PAPVASNTKPSNPPSTAPPPKNTAPNPVSSGTPTPSVNSGVTSTPATPRTNVTPVNGAPPAKIAHEATVPSGTLLELTLNTPIGSDTSAVDDKVDAVLRAPLIVNGEAILESGAVAHGTITEATPSTKADGRGRLAVRFDTIEIGARTLPIP